MKAESVTKALHSRGVMALAVITMVLSAVYAVDSGNVNYIVGDRGLMFPSANEWIASRQTGLWLNLSVSGLIIALMIYINKVFNIPRTITLVYATAFAVMQTASPDVTAQFFSGTVLCLIVSGCMTLMFSTYSDPASLRRVFLVFCLLSTATAIQYAYIFYIPVMAVACAQMRITTIRTILAAFLGIITPWWIMLGFGIVSFSDFHLPHLTSVFAAGSGRETVILIITTGITVLLMITAYMMSILKLMTYNARTRACNGLMALITVVTFIAMCADFTNFLTYIPLLNFCAAFQLSHMLVIRNSPRSWIFISSFVIVYYTLYIWRIFV